MARVERAPRLYQRLHERDRNLCSANTPGRFEELVTRDVAYGCGTRSNARLEGEKISRRATQRSSVVSAADEDAVIPYTVNLSLIVIQILSGANLLDLEPSLF